MAVVRGAQPPVPCGERGQIKLALKRAGRPFDDEAIGPTTWDVWMDKRAQARWRST